MSERQSPDNHFSSHNPFLTMSPGRVFAVTVMPMVAIMTMNGLLGVVDAAFLGRFVGADAITALGIAFPVLMLTIALSTLVSSGMSSLFARQLGSGARVAAAQTFANAHGLAVAISLLFLLLFLAAGWAFASHMAGQNHGVAHFVWLFLLITLVGCPVQFVLALHADAWRNEGRAGTMALISLVVTVVNILLNYLLIVPLNMGVAGSALGTVLAQACGLALLVEGRRRSSESGIGMLPLASLWQHSWFGNWRQLLVLGAPVSLSFIGMAFTATCVLVALSLSGTEQLQTVAAYGVITRILGFVFLPMMAMGLALQSIVGNNVGAGRTDRANQVARIAAGVTLVYGGVVQALLLTQGKLVASAFTEDAVVVGEIARILQAMLPLYLLSGPVFMLGLYFQAIGQPARAGLLTLTKSLVVLPLLILAIATMLHVRSIWFAYPLADGAMAAIALWLLAKASRRATRLGALK